MHSRFSSSRPFHIDSVAAHFNPWAVTMRLQVCGQGKATESAG